MAPTITPTIRWVLTLIAVCVGAVATVAIPPDVDPMFKIVPPIAALISVQILAFLKETPEQQGVDLSNLQDSLGVLENFVTLPPDQQKAVIAFLKAAGTTIITKTTTTATTTTAATTPS